MAAPLEHLFTRELERNDGTVIKINQSEIGDVGCVVWDAAIVLSKYLESNDFGGGSNWVGKHVLELGAGTGVVGLFAASYGADVLITDLPDFLPLMERNICDNKDLLKEKATTRSLIWGKDSVTKDFDYLFLADCIYYEESLEPLVSTIKEHSGPSTCVLCCYEERDTGNKPELERKFFKLIKEDFIVSEVPQESQDAHFRSPDIHIMKFTKKKTTDT